MNIKEIFSNLKLLSNNSDDFDVDDSRGNNENYSKYDNEKFYILNLIIKKSKIIETDKI